VEIEAKYTVSDPTAFATLLTLHALGDYALRPEGDRDLIDHYWDTPNRDLLRGGYVCRVREDETDGGWWLTVKGLGKVDGAAHRREEHESQIPPGAAAPEWPAGPAREIVTHLSGGQPLTELFTLHQHRVLRGVVAHQRAVGMVSLDTVVFEIGGHEMVTHELEIELAPSGTMDDLQAIGVELGPYKLEAQRESKFERAIAMLDGALALPAAKRKRVLDVRADEPLAEAGRRILHYHFRRMLAHEHGTRKGKNIEAVHDMRVAIRRQRAIFRIIAPYFRRKAVRGFQDELRALAARLGAVRDLDVLIEAAEGYQSSLSPDTPGTLEPLLEEWRKQRNVAREALLTYLNSDDYRTFVDHYRIFLSSEGAGVKVSAPGDPPRPNLVCHILPAKIWNQYGRVRAYEPVLGLASMETIHALRIEGKRLRYLLEFFSEALGPEIAEAIGAIVALQDHIGELHDIDVTAGLLREFLMRSPQAARDPAVADAVGRYLNFKMARLRVLQRTLKRPWRRLTSKRFRGIVARAAARL